MRIDYCIHDWGFVARIMDENSTRLSRTRAGVSDISTSPAKPKLLTAGGDALARRSAKKQERLQHWLFENSRAIRRRAVGRTCWSCWDE